ncbi:MAG: cytochrome c biogenesis protein ResB, partial [Pseudobdellovibrio sp.]
FKKSIFAKDESDLSVINDEISSLFKVIEYIPFAKVEKVYKKTNNSNDEVALSFLLKSNFFNVNEWLHTKNNPQMQLGPATLKIVKVSNIEVIEPKTSKKTINPAKKRMVNSVVEPKRMENAASDGADETLEVINLANGQVVKKLSLNELQKKSTQLGPIKISLLKRFRSAVVSANKLEENLDPNSNNPALELKIEKNGQNLREILYGRYEQFSLNKDGVFGYKFIYKASSLAANEISNQPVAHQGAAVAGVDSAASEPIEQIQAPDMSSMGSRVIEFKVNPQDPKRVKVSLYKNNEFVQSEILIEGQNFQTPWMGMKVFLGSIQVGAEETSEIVPINAEKRSQLPPSAIKFRTSDGTAQWLAEGEQKQVTSGDKKFVVYFGREFVDLPFDINLQKFTKYDYPGTTTAMSYESIVQIGKTGITKLISMNEPYKQSGFTIYQASYILNPGETPVSVFSVNKDPGRFIKYLGSLILAIGVIVYTFMKSSFYRKIQSGKS